MKVLVIDSGGRGHAIAWSFKNDPNVKEVICIPGNEGINRDGIRCVPIKSPQEILQFAKEEKIDLAFVGPESYLSDGTVNLFNEENIPIVGPTKEASILESSKAYTKLLCRELGIPVAEFEIFEDPEDAKDYVRKIGYQVVVKADGLAQGKGSIVCSDVDDALNAIDLVFDQQAAGNWGGDKVVIEKRLYGRELSFFYFTDGYHLVPMPVAQDFKRAYDGDQGPNTGGMGAYSPHPMEGPELTEKITSIVAKPLIDGFRERRGILYKGILYLGLMIVDGIPHILEVNVRHGDPEAEVILPRLKTPLSEISFAIVDGRLGKLDVHWSNEYFLDVVAAAGRTKQISKNGRSKGWYPGYPGRYGIGYPISGLDDINTERCKIFFAGVSYHPEKGIITSGGRVLHVVGRGKTLEEARDVAYEEIKKIHFEGMRYRKDIGFIY